MTALPPAVARLSVEDELVASKAWATRHNWTLLWFPDDLVLRAATYHVAARRLVEVTGRCDGYRALPPEWRFVQPGTDETGMRWYPAAGPGSIFHGNALICAPWSRLAYSENGGPHSEWSGPSAWLQVRNVSLAHTIPDMLAAIDAHLRRSPGMMA